MIVPDLPGHGSSEVTGEGRIGSGRIMEWLDGLIQQSCQTPPVLVGQLLGGAIAAHYASRHEASHHGASQRGHRLHRLVLGDTFGLRPFHPTRCASAWERWSLFEAHNLDRACSPNVQAPVATLMEHFAMPAISTGDLARIAVPTTRVWAAMTGQRRSRLPRRPARASVGHCM